MSNERNLRCTDRDQTATKMLEIAIKDGQKCLRKSPVIVLDSGASTPEGLPSMKQLATHLTDSMQNGKLSNLNMDEKKKSDQLIKRLKKKPSRTTTFPPVRRLTVWVLYPRYPPVQPTNEPNSAS